MKRRFEIRLILVLVLATDLLLYAFALRASSFSVLGSLPDLSLLLLQRDRILCMLLYACAGLYAGAFEPRRLTDRFDAVYYALLSLGAALLLQLALATLAPAGVRVISRREMVLGALLGMVLLAVWRLVAAPLLARLPAFQRWLVVVGGKEAPRLAAIIATDRSAAAGATALPFHELEERLTSAAPNSAIPEEVLIESSGESRGRLSDLLFLCETHFERVYLYPSPEDVLFFDHGRMAAIAGIPVVELAGFRPTRPYMQVKRSMDVLLALLGLLLAIPIALAAALAVKLSSRGALFYRQERLGRGGKPFHILKFRSMYDGEPLTDAAGHVLAGENDPRITPVGRVLRRHRIDEIPQLWNVLKGDMSLVGPRPVWAEYYQSLREELPLFDLRLRVRPGLASLSHVLGDYSSEPQDRLRYDLVYISTMSFLSDLKILLSTIRIVLSGRGAR